MHGRTVLIIDDNAAIRTALEVLLSMEGAVVESAESPAAGLARVAAGNVDLVIQDMNFSADTTSGEEGVALFREIRKRHPDLPVILLTAWTHLDAAVDLVKAGAADYLSKPWNDERLLATVANLVELGQANRELGADFEPEAFDHVALWDAGNEWIEMRLRSRTAQTGKVPALALAVDFAAGEELRTEVSAKFRRERVHEELAAAGLESARWWTDGEGRFALSLSVVR